MSSSTKKWLSLLLVLVMVFSLTACQSKPSAVPDAPGSSADAPSGGGASAPASDYITLKVKEDGGYTEEEMLKIDVLGHIQTGSRKPVEDRLTPIWREKSGVIPNIIDLPRSQDANQWLQMNIAGDTLPSVIAVGNNIMEVPERYQMLRNAGMLKEIDIDMAIENMPRTKERLASWGVDIRDWLQANVDDDGVLRKIPTLPSALINPDVWDTRYAKLTQGSYPYYLYFRDDILKAIYPDAKTEEEMTQLILEKNGDLTLEDVLDAPVYTLDGLLEYMRKVKELNVQEYGFTVIPAHPSLTNVPERLYRSLMTATGIWWNLPVYTPAIVEENKFCNFTEVPTFKAYISFLNQAYNEGLLGEEFFIQKDDQREAKMINGEYAVVNNYFPVASARTKALEEGRDYGWRIYPAIFIDLNTGYQDTREIAYSLVTADGAKGFNAHKVTDEMMPKLLRWIDWNYSEEAAQLRAWGTPDMYTGDGEDRRFKDEYADVATYMVTGTENPEGKDGIYYGLLYNPLHQNIITWNHEVYGMTGNNGESAYAPRFVYPLTAETVNVDTYTQLPVKQYYMNGAPEDERHFISIEKPFSLEVSQLKATWETVTGEWSEVNRPYEDERNLLLVEAIVGDVADFEKNYTAFAETYKLVEIVEKEQEIKKAFYAYYKERQKFRERIK